jgi:hypothetical protein
MKQAFEQAMKSKIIKSCAEEVFSVWEKHGKPETDPQTTTGVSGLRPYLSDIPEEWTDDDVSAYNGLIDDLYAMIDVFCIGSGIWYTHYYADEGWSIYSDEAEQIIKNYIDENLWEQFCNLHEWKEPGTEPEDQVRGGDGI